MVLPRFIGEAEALAKSKGFTMINLDVRATQTRAIQSFDAWLSITARMPLCAGR